MNLCILDFETNGSDPATCLPTEVGALMCSAAPGRPLERVASFSSLIWNEHYPPQPEIIVELTGITDEILRLEGKPPQEVLSNLLNFLETADVIAAHNASFDKGVLDAWVKETGREELKKEWLCTLRNFDWPKKYTCRKLGHLAYEHDIPHIRAEQHRAINDCELLASLIDCYDWEKVLAYAREPSVIVRAFCAKPWDDGGVQKEIAQSHGFTWEKAHALPGRDFHKQWVAIIKLSRFDALVNKVNASKSPFTVAILERLS